MYKEKIYSGYRLCFMIACVFVVTLLSSCTSTKNFSYFQDMREGDGSTGVIQSTVIRVRPQDKIYVMVSGKDARLAAPFNIQTSGTSTANQKEIGYTVDDAGNIDFPGLGEIHVSGLTRKEIASKIKTSLSERGLLKEPVVFVEFMNLSFTVLGDVGSPGRYNIEKDQITILDAIAMAGDLAVSGKRKNVMVMRETYGVQQSYEIDLTSAEQTMSSPVYYLQQNDIVYVEPNRMKANQSTNNGNTFRNVSFWMGAISFITSMIMIFVK